MRLPHLFLFAAIVALGSASVTVAATRVIDGDTLVIDGEIIRVLNIDTPEIRRAQCDAERRLGKIAKARLQILIQTGPVSIRRGDGRRVKDRYGRTLARIIVSGRDIGEVLIAEQLARPWQGKRRSWCD